MTNRMKNYFRCKKIRFLPRLSCIGIGLLFSNMALAVTLNAVIDGGEMTWRNGIKQQNHLLPSNWVPLSGLRTTTDWVPGTFMSKPESQIELRGPAGNSVTVDFEVVGLEYNLGQSSGRFVTSDDLPAGYSRCQHSRQSGDTAYVVGFQCIAEQGYSAPLAHTPFQFVRPIIKVDEQAVIEAFQEAKVPSGQYSANSFVHPAYMFKSATGTWTYRKAASVPVTLSLRYKAANLTDIQVIGDGVIYPNYDQVNRTVSGSTYFKILAQGYFTNGLKMTFSPDSGSEYELVHTNTGLDKRIPYNIDCEECNERSIVEEGKMQLSDNETTIDGQGETIDFDLRVYYQDKGPEYVETGNYTDTFIVYFEENL